MMEAREEEPFANQETQVGFNFKFLAPHETLVVTVAVYPSGCDYFCQIIHFLTLASLIGCTRLASMLSG